MTRNVTAGLAQAAARDFAVHVLPHLPAECRYAGAMLKRALEVLRDEDAKEGTPADALIPTGFGTPISLAKAIRARAVPPEADLRALLRAHVEQKLEITNPRFLKTVREGGKGLV